MSKDLENQLDELGPAYREVVSRLRVPAREEVILPAAVRLLRADHFLNRLVASHDGQRVFPRRVRHADGVDARPLGCLEARGAGCLRA